MLTKKHYSAKLFDDTHVTKGISFVRRSGAVITDVAYSRFLSVMQSCASKHSILNAIRDQYRLLRISISTRSSTVHPYMIVRYTRMGRTNEYVNVKMHQDKRVSCTRVLRSDFNSNTMVCNYDYYISLLDKCTDTIAKALGLIDVEFIKTVPAL